MRNERMDNAFGHTPEAFTHRIDQTLRNLEEKPMKQFTLRTALVTALVLALLGSIACAVVFQGMEWYYNNRFTAYQQYEPEKHEDIMEHRQTVDKQNVETDDLVRVEVREASWAPEHQTLVILLAAVPQNSEAVELHPAWNLDADGSYLGAENLHLYADDPEVRAEHWLWTDKGFGPVREMMREPAKQLLLFDAWDLYLGNTEAGQRLMGDMSSVDCYVNENREVMTVMEARVSDAQTLGDYAAQHGGVVTISIPYSVKTYSDDDQQMHDSRYTKNVTFEMRLE